METNKNITNHAGSAQDMLAIARRLAGLPAGKRAVFRQRLQESGIDFSGLPIVPLSERPASIPLSFAQQRLWFLHQLEPDSAAYNIPAALKLEGRVDTAALESAFKTVIARHESLRTVFREIDGKAEQLVLSAIDFSLPVIDLGGLSGDAREAEALRLAQADAAIPFDLGTGPLLRATLLKLADTEYILVVAMHHIVSDGWSMNVLMKELSAYYAARAADLAAAFSPLTIQYADFALWQQEWLTSEVLAAQLVYWKAQLGNAHPVLELPTDRPRPPVQSGRGAKVRFTLNEALAEGLRQRSKEQGATLFMTMLAAFDVLLHRLSGQNELRVGVPIANRNRLETEGVIGFFVNTQALRAQLDARMTFVELLECVKETALGAQAHQDLPFEQLVEALQPERNLSHSPLFQAMFNLQTSRLDNDSRMGDVRLQALPQDSGAAQFDLSLDIVEHIVERKGRLEAVLTYSTDLFESATIERFAGYYTNLLNAIVVAPHTRIGQLPMLGQDEYRQVTADWGVAALVPEPFIAVHAQFEAQAKVAPGAIALVYDDTEFTYADLNAQANRLAHRLIAEGVGADARIGVCIERSPAMIVALLAILKAGAAYVPLDPNYPQERLAYMIEDAGIRLLLKSGRVGTGSCAHAVDAPDATAWAQKTVPTLQLLDVAVASGDSRSHNPGVAVHAQQLAYVMYTSGSTGRPKGVSMTHAALAAHAQVALGFFALQPGERMLQFSTFNFDGFVEQLYPALTCGATVVLRGPDLWDSEELHQRLLRHRITVADFTTAYWFQVVQDWAVKGYTDYGVLRQVNVGGEAMPPEGLSAWRDAGLPHVRLLNTYGPTEAAVTAMILDCAGYVTGRLPKPTQMPIGRALPGRAIYLLDADGNPVPVGAAGELCIGGELLARGYHGRPDLTAERFIPDSFGQPGARLYRTGDLARWKADGVIEYLGRIDHQVKLRGFRIELPEIEACLLSHPAIREAIVLVREDRPGDKRLVAYVVLAKTVADDAVRSHVQASLPDYMVPSALVYLDAMPMNPNGKLDRKALPVPDHGIQTEQAAPRNAIEAQLAAIWAEVLGIEHIGIHDNFFLLGGHSLLATRLVSRIRSVLQCALPVRALFEAPTIAQLAERVQPASSSELAPIPVVPRTGPLPLSFAQQRLWFLHQLEPDSAAYNMPAAVRLVGTLDVPALKQSFEALAVRHETLRMTFREEGGEAVQVIAPPADIAMPIVDLSSLPSTQRETEVKRIAETEAAKPFNLVSGPLLRLTLLKVSDTEHVLLATMHHIVSDGWSMSILTREFAEFYAAASQGRPAVLAPLRIQYADFAAWQRQQSSDDKLKQERVYWKTQLGSEHPVLELPADRPRPPVQSGRGARYRFTIDADLVESLRQICRRQGATTFMALLAIFEVLLARLSGQRDIRVGVPIANRNRVELEGLIGFFVNTQILRITLDGKLRFTELLERVKETALGAQAHQDLPFEQLVEALQPERSLSHSPLFQVMFNLIQSDAAALPALANLVVKPLIRDDSVTQFDLSLDIVERETSLDALFTYSTDLFDAVTIERFAGHYTNLLRAILDNEQTRIGQLPMLGDAELQCLTHDWNCAAESHNDIPPVHKLFEAQAEATPQAVALVFDDIELRYAELNVRANRLAHRLIAEGVGQDRRVGICIERSIDMIVSLLAVLKAGGAYVPLDPNYPSERLAYMAADAGIQLVLSSAHTLQHTGLAHTGLQALDVTAMPATGPAHNPDVPVWLGNLAYVMYTSGSTGKPKGVGITHDALARHSQVGREFFALQPGERMLQFSTFNFDGFVEQLYPALTCGATVVLRGPDLWDSEELWQCILRHRITVADFTTAYWFQVVQDWAAKGCTDYGVLRQVNVGGEAMPPEGLSAWRDAGLSHVRLLNTYGPTEAAVTAMIHDCAEYVSGRVPKPTQMPIGHALPGRTIYLLDADGNPVPVGVAGELCIGGELLARGYHGRPDLTAERFIPDSFGQPGARLYRTGDLARWKADGVIEYLGRIDHQVKLRGFRIELPEIEACLLSHPAIREAVVLVREDRPGDKRLVAYLSTHGDAPDHEALQAHLKASLPDYMVPSALVHLDAMPMNPNGKLDRKALPVPDYCQQAEQTAPRNATEAQLAAIWSDVLGIESVGIHDNFFLLGGHSLLATRLVSRIRSALQCDLPVRALFEAPTIAQLAERLQPAAAQDLMPIPLVPRTGPLPLSFAQQRLWFLHQLEPDSAAYNMPAAVRLIGDLDVPALQQAFEALAARHETLRTTFHEEGGEAVQVIAPQLTVSLPTIDLSTLSYDVREAEITRISEIEAAKPFQLACGPLMRLCLLKLSETEHVLLVTMHHIVSDDWSMSIFTKEFAAFYTAAMQGKTTNLPPLAIQYADFAAWQRQWLTDNELDKQLTYWKTQLGSEHPVLELPVDRPRPPVQSGRGATHRWTLDIELVPALQQLSRLHGATLFMTMLAAFDVLLHRLSGQNELRVGVPIANRNRIETENVIGFFINTQVLRTQVDARTTFADLLDHVKETALGAQAHQDLPFEQLVEALQPERNLSSSPLFQVMFNLLQADAATRLELPGLALQPVTRDDGTTQFDLSLDIVERQGRLEAVLTYSTDLFESATIERFAGYYTNLLRAILVNEQTRIGQLPMLGQDEYRHVTADWGVAALVPEPFIAVHAQFEAQAKAAPGAIALVYDDTEFTYADLNAQANRLAHRLIAEGIGADARIGVCIDRSPAMIVALLAILKAGAAYVPLDPAYPQERLAYMIADAGIRLLLTSGRGVAGVSGDMVEQGIRGALLHACVTALPCKAMHLSPARETTQACKPGRALQGGTGSCAHAVPTLQLLDVAVASGDSRSHNPGVAIHAQQLAYVMYTSGSTGKPKGVGITHDALARHSQVGREFFALQPGERMLQFSTFNFDGFVEQLYPALTCGASVVLRGPDLWDSEELHQRLLRHQITVADFTTAYWFQVVQDWAAKGYTDYGVLRQVNVGGEAMPPEGLTAWRDAGLSHVRLLNTYGPTEAAVTAMIHDCAEYVSGRVPKPTQMPIGRALPGRAIYLLDADGNPVPVGAAGELCIGGELLARGYHGRPDLTAERFIPDPFGQPGARLYRTGDLARWKADGVIEYLGRIDHQVKLRGFRIELPEIEACLLAHPAIREAVVLVREDRPGDKRLVAYLTTHGDALDHDTLRRHVAAELPDYMVPSAFVHLDVMPMNPNGKLDRKALPAPEYNSQAEQTAPRNTAEAQLAAIWSEVLGIESVGIHDNFFLLGGHSLLATRLVSRIRSALQCDLPVRALFEAPTIAQLAERIQPASSGALAPIPVVPRDAPLPLSFAQQRLWFLQQLEPDSAAYNMPAAVRLVGSLDVPALKQAFEALVARHETLRTTFREEEGGDAVQVIAPSADIAMPLVDLSAMPQDASEGEVKRIVATELEQPFDLTCGPVLRITLVKLSATEHVLLLVMHHIAADGWSIGVLVRELGALYAAFKQGLDNPLDPLSIQYADFAAWQRKHLSGEELHKQLAYWRAHLGSDHPVLDLPADRPRPAVMSGNGARHCFEIDRHVTEQLHALSRAHGATLFMSLLAAFDVWLHAHTGRLDPIVGTDIANRNRTETEGLLGFFINQLALKADLSGSPTFSALLTRTRHRVLEAYAHQDLPFNKLVETLNPVRSLAYTPLFQVKLVLQNQAEEPLALPGLEIKPQSIEHEQAEFDLLLVVTEMAGGLECILKYRTDMFDHDTIVAFAQQFAALLARCATEPTAALESLAHAVSGMARTARLARQQTLSTQGIGKLQATRRKSISIHSTSSFKDTQS